MEGLIVVLSVLSLVYAWVFAWTHWISVDE